MLLRMWVTSKDTNLDSSDESAKGSSDFQFFPQMVLMISFREKLKQITQEKETVAVIPA